MADIDVEAQANNPKKARNENGEVESHSLGDLIDADRYVKAKAVKKPFLMGRAVAVPPGPR